MSLADYNNVYPDVDNLIEAVKKYDLFEHVAELEAYGLTVVPAEKMRVSNGFVDRLRDAILRVCEKRNSVELGDYRTSTANQTQVGGNSWDLLEEDEVFIEAATNPVRALTPQQRMRTSPYPYLAPASQCGKTGPLQVTDAFPPVQLPCRPRLSGGT